MPVFTQIRPVDSLQDSTMLALATCTCGATPDGDAMDLDGLEASSSSQEDVFVDINGTRHSNSCALLAFPNHPLYRGNRAQDAIALLKQQQQQKLIGGVALLRKPPVSNLLSPDRHDPFAPVRVLPSRGSHLYAGSRFQGKQKSGSHSYDVMVDFKHINLEESSLCGYLHIKGLTEEYPELTTFFDAEIIGDAHSFVTEKWEADENIDKAHWSKFKSFGPMQDSFTDEKFNYSSKGKDVLYMRWKEHFLVPDHRVEGITGASFAGFYYICYNKSTGEIEGYYYHRSSERFQRLMLSHIQDRSSSYGSYEFR
ncbi:hypothetical protein BG011_008635 [Mortierella polycephala]|uniref:Vacuolar import and degradation protein n=1 Tax=Mortierella polycephala TaxID=41804 RepID=A0A9P6PPK6_9FUNG|nr:hypothetical protein BG011_008635 [Mortierella polycephala]